MSRVLLAALALGLATSAAAQPMATDALPAFGTLSPTADASSVSFAARTGTELTLDAVGCFGYADPSSPDAVVNWGGGDLRFWVRADFDATMLVYGPDGWSCDDDTEGMLPVVDIRSAPAGRYAVWVGAFAPDPMDTDVTLYAGTPPPRPVLNPQAAPEAGTVSAPGGFEASQGSLTLSVSAGGPDPVDSIDIGSDDLYCTGYIDASRPTAALAYEADGGTGTLTIGAMSEDADLVLLVVGPDGTPYCNDDFNGINPMVQIDGPASGAYAVWAGTYSASAGTVDAMLSVGEADLQEDIYIDDYDYEPTPYSEGTYVPLDLDATPSVRIAASETDAGSAEVSVRPAAPNPVQGSECSGYIETAPTAGITLRGDGPFALTASSDDDLTLLVRTPSGGWFCSDDADGLDPGIQIDAPEAGLYLAWVGSFGAYGDDVSVDATISATAGEVVVTSDYDGGVYDEGITQSEGDYDGSEIVGGTGGVSITGSAPQSVEVMAGGTVLNPVAGEACYGFLSRTPSATIEADGMLTVSASADADLTMVVQAPDGTWTCSDDADGSDPAVTVDGGAGTYSVWIGTYSRRTDSVAATLSVE